jgi:putative transposase
MGRRSIRRFAPGATMAPGAGCTRNSVRRSVPAWGAIIDAPTVNTTEPGGPEAMTAPHSSTAARRHRLGETTGLLWRVLVHPADRREADRAPWLFAVADAAFARVPPIWAAMASHGQRLRPWVEEAWGWPLELVARPRRWGVERTIAWTGRSRRLSHDDASLLDSRATMTSLARTRRRLARQAPSGVPSPQRQGLRGLARAF